MWSVTYEGLEPRIKAQAWDGHDMQVFACS